MYKYTHFESLIFNFCSRHNVPMIQPDENLHYVIFVDDIEVRCYSNTSDIYIQSELVGMPDSSQNNEDLFKQIMQQSLLDSFNSKGVICLNDRNQLCIYQRVPFDQCELPDFEDLIESLANQVEIANDMLESFQTPARFGAVNFGL